MTDLTNKVAGELIPYLGGHHIDKKFAVEAATKAIAAVRHGLKADGYAIVPVEPTEAMLHAANPPYMGEDRREIDKLTAWRYRAMVTAAKEAGE